MEKINKKKLSTEIEKIVDSNMQIISNDTEEFEKLLSSFSWDDLFQLKQEIGENTIKFITDVSSLLTNKDIVSNLKDKAEIFNTLVETFFKDINNFSLKVKEISSLHENKQGPLTDFSEYDLYNRLSIQYNSLATELIAITAPIISELILIIKEILPEQTTIEIQDNKENSNGE